MIEYITKEQAKKAFMAKMFDTFLNERYADLSEIRDCIDDIPAADVAPVVQAKWVITDEANVCKPLSDVNVKARNYLEHDCECSNCGFICGIGVGQIKQARYCPQCGARMGGGESDD